MISRPSGKEIRPSARARGTVELTVLSEIWDAQAADWSRFARDPELDRAHYRFNLAAFLELLPPPGRATLDLGCGEGRVGAELVPRGHEVVGIDASPGMVEFATERHEALVADASQLPFADASFDLVVAYMSLMDIDPMPAAVGEAARVLEAGGRLCVAITHPVNTAGGFDGDRPDARFLIESSYLAERLRDDPWQRDGVRLRFACHHRPLEAYSRALEDAGLAIEAVREPPHPGDERWSRVPLFLHLRARKP